MECSRPRMTRLLPSTSTHSKHGITVCNVPIGEEGFVKGYLEQKKNKITRGFDRITTLTARPWHMATPQDPLPKNAVDLNHHLLPIHGRLLAMACEARPYTRVCRGNSCLNPCIGINTNSWTRTTKERSRLTLRNK